MESLKALKSFQIRSLNVLTFSLMIGALSVHASNIYVVLGTDASKVYLRTGEVRLEYRARLNGRTADLSCREYVDAGRGSRGDQPARTGRALVAPELFCVEATPKS